MARAKTERLPGMSNGKIKELSDAAEEYEKIRDRRMKLTENEVESNGTLVQLMKKHKLTTYKDDDFDPPLIVSLKDIDVKAKVRRERQNKEEE